MSKAYYALITSLPELSINDKSVPYTAVEFRDAVKEELAPEDFELLCILYYPFDIVNFVNLSLGGDQEWQYGGNLSREEMEDGIKMPELLPAFFNQFFDNHDNSWKEWGEKKLINAVTSAYLDWSSNIENDFVKRWIKFDQNLKNLLIWLNAKKFEMDASEHVLGSSNEAEYLRDTGPDDLNLKSWDNPFKEALTHFDNPDIAVREFVIDKMRWDYLNELEEKYTFERERLLAFALRVQMIDRNIKATEDKGSQRLEELLIGIKEGYTLPETLL